MLLMALPDQRTRLGQHLQTAYPALMSQLGSNFHSVVLRMTVQIERIALILTALRLAPSISPTSDVGSSLSVDPESNSGSSSTARSVGSEPLICSNQDYATAELIGNKLILHMAAAYRLIKGAEEVVVPKLEPLDQRRMLLSLLPAEFESKTLFAEAKAQGVPQSTVMRWCTHWIEQGLLTRLGYGHYQKIA